LGNETPFVEGGGNDPDAGVLVVYLFLRVWSGESACDDSGSLKETREFREGSSQVKTHLYCIGSCVSRGTARSNGTLAEDKVSGGVCSCLGRRGESDDMGEPDRFNKPMGDLYRSVNISTCHMRYQNV
jgi:hypothetical protein